MSNWMYERIDLHFGHKICVARYGGNENVAIECEDCGEVIVDVDREVE